MIRIFESHRENQSSLLTAGLNMSPKNYSTRREILYSQNFPSLVSCDHAHYILAVKMGEILSKLPNVDFRGKPELKFKDLASIYEKTTPSPEKTTDADVEGSGLTLKELRKRCRKQRPMVVDVDLDEPLIILKQRTSNDENPVRKRKRSTGQQNLDRESEEEQPSTSGLDSEDSSSFFHDIEVKEDATDADVLKSSSMMEDTFACSMNEIYITDNYEYDEMESSSHDDIRSEIPHDVDDETNLVEKSTSDSSSDSDSASATEGQSFTLTKLNSLTSDGSTGINNVYEDDFQEEVDLPQEVDAQVDQIAEISLSHQSGDKANKELTSTEESQPLTMTLDAERVNVLSSEIHQVEDEELHQSKHHPIKLLSNRKVLSPTTQEKLCQAVDADDPVKPPGNGKKLSFEKKSTGSPPKINSVLKLSGKRLLWFERKSNSSTSFPEMTDKKSNNGTVGPAKGILKPVNGPVKKHTQEAVIFSQRQMHDIESLAAKLVNGLRSMKGIMEETLTLEESSSSLNVNAEKMRAAIDDALELEETTKKWLYMMGKDCNRFCKILQRSALLKTTDGLRKDQKKITFADEAGGMLCHVKIFEEPSS